MSKTEHDIVKRLVKNVHNDIDIFVLKRLKYLFLSGILTLSAEKPDVRIHKYPEHALRDCDNINFTQKWWLKFRGEDKYFKMKADNKKLRECVKFYTQFCDVGGVAEICLKDLGLDDE